VAESAFCLASVGLHGDFFEVFVHVLPNIVRSTKQRLLSQKQHLADAV
jgi:hypothetical protein